LSASMILVALATLSAEGKTVKIIITGGDLAKPIAITAPEIVSRFRVWAGQGTTSGEAQSLNVDWSRGVTDVPKGLLVYTVSFVTTHMNPSTYVVRYAIDPSSNHGYVYLPAKGEPEYRDNISLIFRQTEGSWFHAWTVWEKVANPLIAKARASD
jgi:hypothetical protein